MLRIFSISALLLLAAMAPKANAAACPTATMAFYQLKYIGGLGCTSGNLTFFSFGFAALPVNDTVNEVISPFDIMVRPSTTGIGLDFYGVQDSTFNRTFYAPERYYITYVVDPPPIVAGDELRLDPPSGPVTVSRWTCPDTNGFDPSPVDDILNNLSTTQYANAFKCFDDSNPYFLQVDTSSEDALDAALTYNQLAGSVVVRMVIDFREGTVDELEAIVSHTNVVPEPAAFIPLAAGVAGLVAAVRRRRKMLNS